MKNKKGYILMAAGLCLIIAALSLIAYNRYDESRAQKASENILAQLDMSVTESKDENEIPDYILNPHMEMPTRTVDGNEYIGILKIKSIGLTLPVISQCDNSKLKIAPCRYSGSAYLNNMIIAGHDYVSHLGHMFDLEAGDKITFTDTDNNVFNYEVTEIGYLYSNQTEEMLAEGSWDLTLFTCTYSGRQRLTIRARLIGQ
ncbi:MAG: sortase [Clostridia bacterium]|nr:sortase [Clostridia bacterium]